jgi:hypothetical protein
MIRHPFLLAALVLSFSPAVFAEGSLTWELGPAWQSRNEARIPGDEGTLFALTDFGKGPFFAQRLYLSQIWNERHELRALWAPLSVDLSGRPERAISYQGKTFAADRNLQAFYKFNSYRLTYAYHFAPRADWRYALGFTAKIRDAEIRLTQGSRQASKSNVGFVPLLHARVQRVLSPLWSLTLDVDGLAAPQGRAVDAALIAEHTLLELGSLGSLYAYVGYRTVEGGADNVVVYNFAWIHYGIVGFRALF